jgi:hypothetical protein
LRVEEDAKVANMMTLGVGQEANDQQCIWLGCWLLVPNRCRLNVAFRVRGCIEPKPPKRDFVSNGWHRRRNQCGRLVEEAFVNSTKDSLDERVGEKRLKTLKRRKNNLK